jgi:hypothetical protein
MAMFSQDRRIDRSIGRRIPVIVIGAAILISAARPIIGGTVASAAVMGATVSPPGRSPCSAHPI